LRDQLHDDGYDIYVKKVDGESRTRTTLIKDVLEDVSDAEDVEELEDLGTDFLQAATDVRYFGATLSFETSENEADEAFREGLNNALPNHYQGPVQFLPSKSLNEVEENEEYDSPDQRHLDGRGEPPGRIRPRRQAHQVRHLPLLGARRRQRCGVDPAHPGGCGATGYALLAGAEEPDDLSLEARARASPLLRAEYESENYHIGGLHELLDLGEDSADSLRSVNDVVVDASDLVAALNNASDRIKTLHVVADDRINLEVDGETMHGDAFVDHLEDSGHDIHRIDVPKNETLRPNSNL